MLSLGCFTLHFLVHNTFLGGCQCPNRSYPSWIRTNCYTLGQVGQFFWYICVFSPNYRCRSCIRGSFEELVNIACPFYLCTLEQFLNYNYYYIQINQLINIYNLVFKNLLFFAISLLNRILLIKLAGSLFVKHSVSEQSMIIFILDFIF